MKVELYHIEYSLENTVDKENCGEWKNKKEDVF